MFASRGGKGSYRVADSLDFDAVRADPKPLVGFSDITFVHLALYRHCRLGTFHAPMVDWDDDHYGPRSAETLRLALTTTDPITLHSRPTAATAVLTTRGQTTGVLLGGNIRAVGQSIGWGPSYDGAILALEAIELMPGEIDGPLTQLLNSGGLAGVRGVAIGQFIRSAEPGPGKWSFLDILSDRLGGLGVPLLGGLPIGHGPHPPTVPLGTRRDIGRPTEGKGTPGLMADR